MFALEAAGIASAVGLASGAADTLPPVTIIGLQSRIGKFVEFAALAVAISLDQKGKTERGQAVLDASIALLARRGAHFHATCIPNAAFYPLMTPEERR